MKWRVLVSAPYAMPVIDMYKTVLNAADCDVVVAEVNERLSEAELLPLVGDVDAIICGDDAITSRVLDAAPRLKVISKWGTGIDSIDPEACAERGVKVCNTPNAFSEPVADTVLGYMLMFTRKLEQMNREIREGHWDKPASSALRESTLGIIGLGNCGSAVARRAAAFGMKILANDLLEIDGEFLGNMEIEMVSKEQLLSTADFVTLNTTLNPSSYQLMNDSAFLLMKPTAFLINTSRGDIVDEVALVHALEKEQLAGAGLDVFSVEPLPLDSPLRRFDNCWLGCHNANRSPQAAENVHQNTLRNALSAFGQ
jgi:D-3-phosphoglycerate dehydrogenase